MSAELEGRHTNFTASVCARAVVIYECTVGRAVRRRQSLLRTSVFPVEKAHKVADQDG